MKRTCESLSVLALMFFGLASVGSARAQDVSLLPTSLNFSSQIVGGTSAVQGVTLTNTDGAHALAISSIAASGNFTETNTCGSSVAAGESCAISVKFAPAATGTIDGSISISDNAPGSPQVLALKGTGITQETLSTTSFDFGTVSISQTSEAETIKLTNHTAAAIAISSIKASADYVATPAATGGCGSTLAANSSCGETVVFAPTELGLISGSLIFTDAGKQQYVGLVGHAVGTAGSPLTLTPATLAFGNQAEGSTSTVQSATIKNTGTTSLTLTFAASGSFSKSNPASGACGSTLAGGASCTIDVQFSPAVLGFINGGISISYSGADSPQVVSLTGTGIGQVTVSPSSIVFSSQQVGTTSAAKTVTVTNNSASAVSVGSIVKSADFIQTNTCGTSIAAGKSCTVSISFAPNRGGSVLGSVIVTDSATNSPQLVDLSGSSFLVSRFAYVPNAGDNTVSLYTVNGKTGQLRSNGYVLAGADPQQVTVDPSGRFAYVANEGSNSVSAYTINASTGALTPIPGSPYTTEDSPVSVTVDPSGKFVYVANNESGNISAYTINGDNGALTPVPGSPFTSGEEPNSVVVSPSGKFVYVANQGSNSANISAYTVDATSGVLTPVEGSPFPFPSSDGGRPTAAAVNPAGSFLYVSSNNDSDVAAFSINAATGALTLVTGSPFQVTDDCTSLTIAPSGKFLYLAGGDGSSYFSVFEINTSGALTPVAGSPFLAGSSVSSVTLNPQGNILYVTINGFGTSQPANTNEVWTYSIASTSGIPSLIGQIRAQQGPMSLALGGGTAAVTYTPTFAYVANQGSSTIASSVSAYAINASNGDITAVSGSPFLDGGAGTFAFATSVTVDPSGRFAYVANESTNDVAGYTIDSSSGALIAINCSMCSTGMSPTAVAADPSGQFVYVTNIGSSTVLPSISAYTINAITGALTPVSGSPFPAGGAATSPNAVTVDPTGQFVYVASESTSVDSGNIAVLTIDAGTGALAAVSGSPFATGVNSPSSVAVDSSGRFAYVGNQAEISSSACSPEPSCYLMSSFAINASTGALTFLSFSPPVGAGVDSVATDPISPFIYGTQDAVSDLVALSFNSTSHDFTLLNSDVCIADSTPVSITVDPSGKFAYVANSGANDVTACAIEQSTGDLGNISHDGKVAAGMTPVSVVTTGTVH
jgi:6-phosphogluconolactonase (cycloisomerase 2 family)